MANFRDIKVIHMGTLKRVLLLRLQMHTFKRHTASVHSEAITHHRCQGIAHSLIMNCYLESLVCRYDLMYITASQRIGIV